MAKWNVGAFGFAPKKWNRAGEKFLFGTKDKVKEHQNFDPQQLDMLSELIEGAKSGNQNAFEYLNQILSGDPEAMEAFSAPAKQEFEEDIIPSILERFSGMGARSSSALNQTLGRAGQTLATNINSQRAQLKGNAINQLMGYSQQGLTQKSSPYIKQGQQGLLQAAAPAAAQAAVSYFGAPAGAPAV